MAPPKSGGKRGTVQGAVSNGIIKFVIRAAPLPKDIFEFLRDNVMLLRRMQQEKQSNEGSAGSKNQTDGASDDAEDVDDAEDADLQGEVLRRPTVRAEEFWPTLREMCKKAGGEWADVPERLWAFGPQNAGTCMLVDARSGQPTS